VKERQRSSLLTLVRREEDSLDEIKIALENPDASENHNKYFVPIIELFHVNGEQKRNIDLELTRHFPKRLIERILLVAPPEADSGMFEFDTAKRGRYWNFPPYGLGIIASHLRLEGISVQIVNLNHVVLKACNLAKSKVEFDFDKVWKNELAREIEVLEPDIVGITCMFSQSHTSAVRVCNEIKRLRPNLPIAIGGVHITNCFIEDVTVNSFLDDFKTCDFLFPYESELAFKKFIKIVNQEMPSNELAQICFNSSDPKLYLPNNILPEENEINIIPAHDLMDSTELASYGTIGSFYCLTPQDTRFSTVLMNRGCRAQCTFCSVRNFNGVGVRHRSVQSIIDELLILRNEYQIGHIMWLDDDFLHDRKKTLQLFSEMVKQNVGITWDCTNGVIASSCTDEIIEAAAESGCLGLNIGVESGNPDILRKIKKPGNVNTFLKAAEVLRKHEKINTRVFLIIGFPGETRSMMLDTVNLAMAMDLDWYNITIYQPLPNTPMFETMVQDGLIDDVSFENIRYSSGPYGKIRQKAERNLFVSDSLDEIWFRMNYYLNFERLYKVESPVKLHQQFKYVQNIAYLVARDDAFAMYFCGYMQKKVLGNIDKGLTDRLEDCLLSSVYWRTRFDEFNLSLDHLKEAQFPGVKQTISLSGT